MKLSIKSLLLGGSGIFIILLGLILLSRGLSPSTVSKSVDQPHLNQPGTPQMNSDSSSFDLPQADPFDNFTLNASDGKVISNTLQEELDQYEESDVQGFNTLKDQDIVFATIEGIQQIVTISVDENGFSAPMVVLQKGLTAEINFKVLKLDYCNQKVFISSNPEERALKEGDNIISITPSSDFSYQCWTGIHYGYVAVVDDIKQYDLTQLKDIYNAFEANIISASGEAY